MDGRTLDIPSALAIMGEVRAPIPASVVAASLGKTVEVTNVILVDGGSGVTSPALALRVQDLPATALKPPKVVQASDGTLDLNTFSTAATVSVDPWPLIATGQTYWLRAHGTLDDGTTRSEELAMGSAVTAAQVSSGLHINLPRSFLLRLENTLPLTLELKVGLGKSLSEREAVIFPEGVLNMTQLTLVLPAPTVENETNGHLDPAAIPNTGVKITTPVYGGIEAGQWVGLEWTAVDPAVSLVLPARRLTTAQPLEFTVPKAVAELSQDKAVSVAYTVARVENGLVKTSEAVPFELGKIETVTPPGVEGFDTVPLGPVSSSLVINQAEIYLATSVQADIIQDPPVDLRPFISGNAFRYIRRGNGSDYVMISLWDGCTEIEFGISVGSTIRVAYLGGQAHVMDINPGWVRIDVKDNPGWRISKVCIYAKSDVYGYLDNISIKYDSVV
ncbi:hypothetical protein AHFPHNDE_03857 [Pseudomonas sp. MM227]|uniref:hypothetical protein n=1 Tax=Pseudomonas sp. MM227 TaxID=3019968 RepID=UPI00221ECC75|nr:hypothetical protein [Pseudomonas sp. MM227]CAI3790138.1 hypothetical protein AHFPHNDE_03857 [Pseudomonas sp. MM227]